MDGIQANITSSIITMVSRMGLETIAEGVQTAGTVANYAGFTMEEFGSIVAHGHVECRYEFPEKI